MNGTGEADTGKRPATSRPRVLVAIDPRSYREAIGAAIQNLRPRLEVTVVEPDSLGSEVTRWNPEVVICSLPETSLPSAYRRPAWVEFRPYDRPAAKISVDGRYFELEEVDLTDLLSLLDDRAAVAERIKHQPRTRLLRSWTN